MKKVLCFSLITLLVIVGFLGCDKRSDTYVNNTSKALQQNEELDKNLEDLVIKSLDIQYGISNIELTEVFSKEYIKKIQSTSKFYKKELKPYKIISINHDEIKDMSINNLVIFIRIEDRNGEYQQNMHLIKRNDTFVVDEIEYDI
jgi:hypothetical protein